jgi:hypothetical protein
MFGVRVEFVNEWRSVRGHGAVTVSLPVTTDRFAFFKHGRDVIVHRVHLAARFAVQLQLRGCTQRTVRS